MGQSSPLEENHIGPRQMSGCAQRRQPRNGFVARADVDRRGLCVEGRRTTKETLSGDNNHKRFNLAGDARARVGFREKERKKKKEKTESACVYFLADTLNN